MRVITKAARAARISDNFAVPCTVGNQGMRVIGMLNKHNRRVIKRAPIFNALHRRNQFFIGLGASLGAAGLAVLASKFVMDGIIGNQNSRNDLLKTEISALDKRIADILELEAKKDRLLARMEIIEQLQRSVDFLKRKIAQHWG